MLKKFRVYVSILLITFLLFSPLLFSRQLSVKACPPPPPETLLSLFLRSDVIFVADISSEKDGETTVDEEYYKFVDVVRNLNISKVLKGKTGRGFSFTQNEYRDKTPPEEISSEYETEDYSYSAYSYLKTELTVGERYLFFFTKNDETGTYGLSDGTSGFRNLNERDLGIFERRIEELKTIIATKENQLEALTAWYVKCIEEPSTRWDGVMSLQSSFNAFEYEDEQEKAAGETFVFNKEFREYAPEIAANLSSSQKEFLSGIVFSSLQQNLFESDGYNSYGNLDYIVKKWDKPRLAMFAFSIFQTTDKSDIKTTNSVMNYIASITEDNEFWRIVEQYNDAENTAKLATESGFAEIPEEAESETKRARQSEQPTVNENQPTADQLREKALQDFTAHYYQLLARNFVDE